jgi:putative intracellular protease/amidase
MFGHVMPSSAQTKNIKEAHMKKILFVVTSHDQLGDTGRKTGFYLPEVVHPNVVVDGRLITGQNPASAKGVGSEIVKLLTK